MERSTEPVIGQREVKSIKEHISKWENIRPAGNVLNDKICPFMSSAQEKISCTPECKIYRYAPKKAGYECPFQELAPTSFALRSLLDFFKAKFG